MTQILDGNCKMELSVPSPIMEFNWVVVEFSFRTCIEFKLNQNNSNVKCTIITIVNTYCREKASG